MKRRWISCASLAFAASLMLAGCSNVDEGEISGLESNPVVLPEGESLNRAENTVLAVINGIPSVQSLRSQIQGRTVLPDVQEVNDSGLIYVLEGSSANGNTIDAQKVSVEASANADGQITISFPDTSIWELTLTAYKTDGDTGVQAKSYLDGAETKTASDPVLTATTEFGFSGGVPTVTFNMNVKGLETPGSVSIESNSGFVYTGNTVNITKYEIALYDIITGAQISTQAASPLAATTGKVDVTPEAGTVNFTADSTSLENVAPGEYVLGVTFYNTYNGNDYQVGFWSDYVVVAPGQTTEFEDVITGIEDKPADPSDFTADLVENSENNGTYLVKLNWTDNATNESNYEIDLYEVLDAAKATALDEETIKADTNATKLATLGFKSLYSDDDATTGKIIDFKDGSLYYGAGSLFASSTSATLKLDTGKLYEVVLRAVKSATDKSADVVREASTTATVGYKADTNHINRVRLSYITAPYTITVGTAVGQQYVTYDTYESADIDLMTTGFTLAYKGTDIDASNFKGWISAQDGKTPVEKTDYKNVTVLADVKVDVTGLVNTYSYSTDVDKTFVALKSYADSTDTTGTEVSIDDDNIATVNATDNERLTISAVDDSEEFSGFIIALDGFLYTQSKDCTLYLSRLGSGSHNILVAGEKADSSGNTTLYSYSFTLKIER